MPMVGKPKQPGTTPQRDMYVAQVYVNRRKQWEQAYPSEQEATSAATSERKKYDNQGDAIIVVRKQK